MLTWLRPTPAPAPAGLSGAVLPFHVVGREVLRRRVDVLGLRAPDPLRARPRGQEGILTGRLERRSFSGMRMMLMVGPSSPSLPLARACCRARLRRGGRATGRTSRSSASASASRSRCLPDADRSAGVVALRDPEPRGRPQPRDEPRDHGNARPRQNLRRLTRGPAQRVLISAFAKASTIGQDLCAWPLTRH
jgi:hypothetical protein